MPRGIGGAGESRRDQRFGLPVRVRVKGGQETGATPWEEVTTTKDASAGGASFVVDHPLAVGDVVRLQVLPPLPETLGKFELTEPTPAVYAVVRSSTADPNGRRVGVKFFSDVDGLMPAAVPAPPRGTDDRRGFERYATSVHFVVRQPGEGAAGVTEALTVAENISRGGAQLLAPLDAARGDIVFLREAGGPFETRAEVQNAGVDEDGLRRLNLKFLDGRSPGHLFPMVR